MCGDWWQAAMLPPSRGLFPAHWVTRRCKRTQTQQVSVQELRQTAKGKFRNSFGYLSLRGKDLIAWPPASQWGWRGAGRRGRSPQCHSEQSAPSSAEPRARFIFRCSWAKYFPVILDFQCMWITLSAQQSKDWEKKEALLTLAIAERPVLLAAGGRLRGRARDGVAEHLLLGRLQHKAVGFNQHVVRTHVCMNRCTMNFILISGETLTRMYHWQEGKIMLIILKQLFMCLQTLKQTNASMSRVTSLPDFMVIEITTALTSEKTAAEKWVNCTCAATQMKEKAGDMEWQQKVQIIEIIRSCPPLPILKLLKFPVFNNL